MTQAIHPPPTMSGYNGLHSKKDSSEKKRHNTNGAVPPPPPAEGAETIVLHRTWKQKAVHFFGVVTPGVIGITALVLILIIVPRGSSRETTKRKAAAQGRADSEIKSHAGMHVDADAESNEQRVSDAQQKSTEKQKQGTAKKLLSKFRLPSPVKNTQESSNKATSVADSGSSSRQNVGKPGAKAQSAQGKPGEKENQKRSSRKEGSGETREINPGSMEPDKPRIYVVDENHVSCSDQSDLETKALSPVAARLSTFKVAGALPDPPYIKPDWEGLKNYLRQMLVEIPEKPHWAKSLRAFRNARVHYSPDLSSDEVGLMAKNSRIIPYGFVKGKGCRGSWIALGPRAYTCRRNFVWDQREPKAVKQPPMEEDDITPGQYAYVRPGGTPVYSSRKATEKNEPFRTLPGGFFVRFKRFVRIKDTNYWKTTKNWYIPVDKLARHVPSELSGIRFPHQEVKLPVAFLLRDHRIYGKPGGGVADKLPKHSIVPILGIIKHGRRNFEYYRIGPCRWMRSTGTRAAWPSPPPPGVHKDMQWVDLNLESQTMVAYEGTQPVMATMFSSGDDEHPTKHGIFRVYWKISETDMTSDMGAENEYMAESVPWSLFFWKGQAIHGAYWHDSFGIPRSHGCVNLSPKDARFLMDWSKPELPDGWIYRWFGERFPGLLLRIRRQDGDLVRFLGFAKKLAPEEAAKERDKAFKERIREETLEILKKRQEQKTEKTEKQE